MTEIFFAEQNKGYDKTQVENYIRRFTEACQRAYQTTYQEYQAVCGKYDSLAEDYERLKAEKQAAPAASGTGGVDVVAEDLIDSEILAQKIIENANAEAARIIAKANSRLEKAGKMLEQTMSKVQKLLADGTKEEDSSKVIGIGCDESA